MKLEHLPEGSHIGSLRMDIGIAPVPQEARSMLPECYGVPQFEFLVVDPEYVFVAWEITPSQLESYSAEAGDLAFSQRVLAVRLLDATDGSVVQERELYGELGRWFIGLARNGYLARAELVYKHDGQISSVLMSTQAVGIPRTSPVDCTAYEELAVDYGQGVTGEAVIMAVRESGVTAWPPISLPRPGMEDLQPIYGSLVAGSVWQTKQRRER